MAGGGSRASYAGAGWALFWLAAAVLATALTFCGLKAIRRPIAEVVRRRDLVLVTGYCNCEKCCGWRPDPEAGGRAVYASGPLKGRPKEVGVTASGQAAHVGTVAADLSRFPMGTLLLIPEYGIGHVEDTGGAIRGRHIDVWFPTHEEALRWGARWLPVRRLKGGR